MEGSELNHGVSFPERDCHDAPAAKCLTQYRRRHPWCVRALGPSLSGLLVWTLGWLREVGMRGRPYGSQSSLEFGHGVALLLCWDLPTRLLPHR